MKNHSLLLVLLLACCSCAKTDDVHEIQFRPVVITGQFLDHHQYPNTQKITAEGFVYWADKYASDSIADDGSFRLAFDLYEPQQIALKPFDHTYVYLEPGDSVHVIINIDGGAEARFTGDRAQFNRELYNFHNGGFLERWEGKQKDVKRLGINDALTYLNSFYEIDTMRLHGFMERKSPSPEIITSLSAYLLNRHHDLLFEQGMIRQGEDLQAENPNTEAYFRAVASQFRSNLPEMKAHPLFKHTMISYNTYFTYHKLHGPYHKLLMDPEDYSTYHEIVALEEDPVLQRELLFSFGTTLLDIGKTEFFPDFWEGISPELQEATEMQKLRQLYLKKAMVTESVSAT